MSQPFQTLNYAWQHLAATLDPGPYTVTISVATGSYPLQIGGGDKFISGAGISVIGAGSSNTHIIDFDMAGNHPVSVDIDNVTFVDDNSSLHNAAFFTNGLATFGLGFAGSNDIAFDTTANSGSFGINPTNHTDVFINSLTAKGDANQLLNPADHGTSMEVFGTITLVGTPAYSIGLAQVFDGTLLTFAASIVGTFTGPKYQVGQMGYINNSGGSAYPGTIEGQVFEGGIYAGPDVNVIFTPLTGDTITMVNLKAIINPAGTLDTLTIHLPVTDAGAGVNWFAQDTATVTISTTQILTALTLDSTDGTTVVSPPTTLAKSGAIKMIFDSPTTTWYPTQ